MKNKGDTMTKELHKSFNVVYKREYFNSEDADYFWSSYSLYKNVPISKLKYYRKQLLKFKDYMDKSFKEDATNFAGATAIEIIYPDEYYKTYEDVLVQKRLQVTIIYLMIMASYGKDKVLEKTLIQI